MKAGETMDTLTPAAGSICAVPQDFTQLFPAYISFIDRNDNTEQTYIKALRQFGAWLRFRGIQAPAREDIIAYRDYLLSEHEAIAYDPISGYRTRTRADGSHILITCKPSTAAQYLRTVRAFFTWTAQSGIYPNIAAGIHTPKVTHETHRKEALKPAEVLQIERSIEATAAARRAAAQEAQKDTAGRTQRSIEQGKRLRAMYILSVNAGLRTIEISRANVKDIVTKSGKSYIYIWGKGHTEPDTRLPIVPEVKAAIDDYLRSRSDSYTGSSPLFVSTGNRSKGQRIAPTTISTMLKRAMQAAGFDSEYITAHSLRHSAGTNTLLASGYNIFLSQRYLRHKSPVTTLIYAHNRTEEQEEQIAQRLYALYHEGPAAEAAPSTLEETIAALDPAQIAALRTALAGIR